MLSPLASSKRNEPMEKQLSDLRALLNESQSLLGKHLENLNYCSQQIDSTHAHQNFQKQFSDLELELNNLLGIFREKLNKNKNQNKDSTASKLVNLQSSVFTDELRQIIVSGKNLIDSMDDKELNQDLADSLENIVSAFSKGKLEDIPKSIENQK
ncbi:hypothetical protein CLIB1423_02S08416 [[Candida] railenensis]|uniref:Uncharacterized protein n=1 Tax=[Candida] railenensis TaxID=45579 RepID=A0A9P0QLN8_9ASCO|nr:hypothetical protein CLIB1423_02S08416 [[Candida] railenensis]